MIINMVIQIIFQQPYVINLPVPSDLTYSKARRLLEANCAFSEFGTRRRRSFHAQDVVVQALLDASKAIHGSGGLLGTSNVRRDGRI